MLTETAAAVNLKQVTDFLNTKQNKSYYELIFEYFFDLLDPDSFDMADSYGSNIKSVGGKLMLKNTVSLADFDVKNGIRTGYFAINLDEMLTKDDDFTLFVSFLHDNKTTSYLYYHIGLSSKSFSDITTVYPPAVAIKNDGFGLKGVTGKVIYEESIPSAYRNKRLFLWFCKQGNTYKVIICQGGHINETIAIPASTPANRVALGIPYKVQRIGFSKNFYNLYEKEFHKISFLEKANGTFFE